MSSSELTNSIDAAADVGFQGASDEERRVLITACERLRGVVETPIETTLRFVFSAYESITLRLGVDMGLFDAAASVKGSEFTVQQLADKTGGDPLLISRIIRPLASMNVFREVGPGTFVALPIAGIYVSASPFANGIKHITFQATVYAQLPGFFAAKGYKNPSDAYDCPFQFAKKTDKIYFDWLETQPKQQEIFNKVMSMPRPNRGTDWWTVFPVIEKLTISDPSQVLLVDIGGGIGHDTIAFKTNNPELTGNVILQDLPRVIEKAQDLPTDVQAMGYDFFKPQSIKGAKAYYLRAVLHDWPDKQAREILGNVRAAMDDKSLLLINESAVPETNVPFGVAAMDLTMMAMFAGCDRTEAQWRDLLVSAGFDVIKAWRLDASTSTSATLFETVRKA